MLYKEQGRYDEAEKLLLEAVEGRRLKLGDTHPHTLESWHNLIELYEAWNKPDEAEKWRSELLSKSYYPGIEETREKARSCTENPENGRG